LFPINSLKTPISEDIHKTSHPLCEDGETQKEGESVLELAAKYWDQIIMALADPERVQDSCFEGCCPGKFSRHDAVRTSRICF
jgi:hypothetical protein